ncbi:hypothetical protein [Methanocella conradii]|nr:hypothetical protein [Methanocella conradii]MDI6896519.1 hypothetical protein [Methanocella conradii]
MSGRMSVVVVLALIISLFMGMMPMAFSDADDTTTATIPLDQSFYCMRSDVEVHLLYLEVGNHQKGNTYPTTPLDRVKWVRLFYRYENHGDHVEDGYIQPEFYDEQGNQYKLNEGTYTGEDVKPGAMSSLRFVEIPIPKDSNIVKLRFVQGFNNIDFDVPVVVSPTPTPEPTVTPTPIASPTATTGTGGNCLPLLPFAILGMVGLAGLATTKGVIKK